MNKPNTEKFFFNKSNNEKIKSDIIDFPHMKSELNRFVPFKSNHKNMINSESEVLRTLQKGIDAQHKGIKKEAEYFYQLVLKKYPENSDALNLMGVLAAEEKFFDIAIFYLEKAIFNSRKDNPVILNNLSNAYIMVEMHKKAIPLLEKAIQLSKNNYEIMINMARAYRGNNQASKAAKIYYEILALKPNDIDASVGLARALTDSGCISKAKKIFKEVLSRAPSNVMAYYGLSRIHKYTESDDELPSIEKLLKDECLSSEEKSYLHYSAGKINDDLKRYKRAFTHFVAAKEFEDHNYNISSFQSSIDYLIKVFDKDFFSYYNGYGQSDVSPIFIVGMPRSGTTLIEQILSSHPDIYGAGELNTISSISERFLAYMDEQQSSQDLCLDPEYILSMAKEYIDETKKLSNNTKRVIDKMPHNFCALGLIYLLFPNARIVHCSRNPIDTCLSCFTHKFTQSHRYNSDLKTLGLYYKIYRRLMKHWFEVLPTEILTVQYEDMVNNQIETTRQLLNFVEEPWHEDCLNFHKSKREISTPSNWQVRQPIYKSSLSRRNNYKQFLGDLYDSLKD